MKWLILCCLVLTLVKPLGAAEDGLDIGPLFDRSPLVLEPGERTEAAGPFFYDERQETFRKWAIPPFFSFAEDTATESKEYDFLYPILSYDRYGRQYRWHIVQIFNFAGGPTQVEDERHRFTLFPIYFHQSSSIPDENYTAVFPIYGHMMNRLFRDDIFFISPFYVRTRKKDVITENYFYPFFHLRHGDNLTGWQFWPLVGQEHKGLTTRTNGFGDIQLIGGHEQFFLLWPIYHNEHNDLGTGNPEWRNGVLPFYALQRSPKRDMTTVLWPFFSRIEDREKKYVEWQLPWPMVDITRGEGKTITRFLPFYSHARDPIQTADSYLWPIYRFNSIHSDPVDRQRIRILFFLYSDIILRNMETGGTQRRMDFWPFFTRSRTFNGNTRLQVLALIEPIIPNNKSIERNYSPLWTLWRSEKNPRTGASTQSLLWNLYHREASPKANRCSVLFGLFQYRADEAGKRWRLFYIPLGKSRQKFSDASFAPMQDEPGNARTGADSPGVKP